MRPLCNFKQDLDRYMVSIDDAYNRQELINIRAEELLSSTFNPYSFRNFMEAMANWDTDLYKDAESLLRNENDIELMYVLRKFSKKYWEENAIDQAEKEIQ